MRTILTCLLCACLLLLDLVSAAPSKLQKRSFKINRYAVAKKVRSPQGAMRKSYSKWGFPMPAALATPTLAAGSGSNTTTGETGEVSNTPVQDDVEFVSPVTIGGQTIMMDFDTGSSDLWVFSTDLPAADTAGHTLFDPTKSATFKPMAGATFNISFGDGSSASGKTIGTDIVNIGGASVTQTVELANVVSGSFVTDTSSNGLVGLAFSSLNTVKPKKATTFFDSIKNDLAEPVFTANLKHDATGFYEFGVVDNTQFTGNLNFAPVDNSNGFWQFQSSAFAVGNGAVQANTQNSPAIADTGTTLMLADASVVNGYYSQVTGAKLDNTVGGVTFPCNSALPDLQIALGPNYMGTIPGALMNFQVVSQAQNTCFGGLQSNGGANLQIFGDIMFKGQFVTFNIANNTLGFAPHAA